MLVQNRQGKTRVAKWYMPFDDEEKLKLKGEVHRLVASRDQKHQSNFVEVQTSIIYSKKKKKKKKTNKIELKQFRNYKVVYKRYAGLFFCLCVDINDNELAYLEAIHLFVETLDSFFQNVCELDLVFNFYKVCLSFFLSKTLFKMNKIKLIFSNRCTQYWMKLFLEEKSWKQVEKLS